MTVRKLTQLSREEFGADDTLLRKQSECVTRFDEELVVIVNDLVDTLMAHKIAVGLAAPQIGISKRICAINLKQPDSETIVLVNPQIESTSGKKVRKKESCMSLPHFRGEVERREKVAVTYQSPTGEKCRIEGSGFLARVLYHELDHLDGLLYIDRVRDWSSLERVDFFND